jgi:single-strand DNA-binding protein
VTWNKLAEICSKHLKKGAAIYLEGRMMNRSFLDKEGVKKAITEIVADGINFINYKKSRGAEQINLVEMPA